MVLESFQSYADFSLPTIMCDSITNCEGAFTVFKDGITE